MSVARPKLRLMRRQKDYAVVHEYAYQNGWYEKALNDFLESERENYQDFAVHRSIANIYLYHLINLPEALE